jgi:hypothetical protein
MDAIDNSLIPDDALADLEAVCKLTAAGKQPDPALARRIRERADHARQEVLQQHGVLDLGVPGIRELRDAE